jgi:hypothetical protein
VTFSLIFISARCDWANFARLRVNYGLRASGSIAKRDVFVHYIELCRANKYVQPNELAACRSAKC